MRAFPPPVSGQAGQSQISTGGATTGAAWSRRSRELIYGVGDQLMTVGYSVNGDSLVPEKPRVRIDKLGGVLLDGWDLAPEGQRVAVITPDVGAEAPKPDHEVTILFNFFDELRRRIPAK